jgi:hypothetical protein
MEIVEVYERLTKMRDANYNFPDRDALTIAIEYIRSYDIGTLIKQLNKKGEQK